ncbi:MAG: response regulator transcription factor [Rhodanobacteraceae bacterium]|jgi:DNA-binding NarL/FixJ family response regulator|nr:response regulator transcription factor [Rhodanobacteraceae bacterium]
MSVRKPASLLIAVSSALIQRGLIELVKEVPALEYRGSASDALGVASALQGQRPDVLIIDDALAPVLRDLRRDVHVPRVLLLSARAHLGTEPASATAGVCGVLRVWTAAKHVRVLLSMIGNCEAPRPNQGHCSSCPLRSTLALPRLPLSARECTVFQGIGRGESNLQIARELGLSVKTIETHCESIKRKLALPTAAALIEAAFGWRRGDYVPEENPVSLARASGWRATRTRERAGDGDPAPVGQDCICGRRCPGASSNSCPDTGEDAVDDLSLAKAGLPTGRSIACCRRAVRESVRGARA